MITTKQYEAKRYDIPSIDFAKIYEPFIIVNEEMCLDDKNEVYSIEEMSTMDLELQKLCFMEKISKLKDPKVVRRLQLITEVLISKSLTSKKEESNGRK